MTFLVFSVLPAPDSPLPKEPRKFSGRRGQILEVCLSLSPCKLYCLPFYWVPMRDPTPSDRKGAEQINATLWNPHSGHFPWPSRGLTKVNLHPLPALVTWQPLHPHVLGISSKQLLTQGSKALTRFFKTSLEGMFLHH